MYYVQRFQIKLIRRITSFTPGSISVVLDNICVNTVAINMCHVVINIGNGKSIEERTALLNRICNKLWCMDYKIGILRSFAKERNFLTIVQLIDIQNTM